MEKRMRQNKEYHINWVNMLGILILIGLLVVLIWFLYPDKKENVDKKEANSTYINNISLMKEAGFEFFKGNNLPTEVGVANRISLSDMINNNLIVEFLDESGNTCNKNNSYVQVTKVEDSEYRMKVFLSCDSKTDYIETMITVNNNTTNNNNNSNNDNKPNDNNNTNNKPNNGGSTNNNQTINKVYNITYINNCNGNCVNNTYFTVSFNSNGGSSVSSQIVKKDGYASYVAPSRSGYRFLGWYEGNTKFDFTKPITKTTNLTAKWEKINTSNKKQYTVSFNSNGGTKVSSQTVYEGSTIYVPTNPTRTNYEFVGWYYYDQNGIYRRFDFNTGIYSNITLYAKWEQIIEENHRYTVSFNSEGGSYVKSQVVYEGDTAYVPANPTRTNYEFVGWYYYNNYGNLVRYDFNTRVYNNITLYAKWESTYYNSTNRYTVSFNSEGGSYVSSQTVYAGNTAYVPVNPTRANYEFVGWYYYNNYGNLVRYDFNTRVYNNITLYAKWESTYYNPTNRYTVSFNTNGGNSISSQTVYAGNTAYTPANPTKKCYTFMGWYYYDANGNYTKFSFNTRIYRNTTLYAKWEKDYTCEATTPKNYTVKFVYNNGDGTSTRYVQSGYTVSKPATPTRSSYEFLGWYLNGKLYDFNTPVYQDITIEAKWGPTTSGRFSKYCKMKTEGYYPVGYINANGTETSKKWTIEFTNINSNKVTVSWASSAGSTLDSYNYIYNNKYNTGISWVGSPFKTNVIPSSSKTFFDSSLKSDNFTEGVTIAYQSGNKWRVDLDVNVKNTTNVTPYYVASLGHSVYFTPYYVQLKYTDLDDCVIDYASNKNDYKDYEIVETFTR